MSSQAMERQRDFRDRYTTAATQLGHASSAIRLAGVYALVGLADEWLNFGSERDGQMTIDLLRSYLRVKKPTADEDDEQESEVRSTILLEFASRSNWYSQATDDLRTVADEPRIPKRDVQFALDRLRRQRKPKSAL